MPRSTLIFSLVLALAGPWLAAAETEYTNALDDEHAPLVRENALFETTITVRNPNDRAVIVRLMDNTCSCSKLELKDRFLLPGAATTLEMAVKNANRSGPQKVGVSIFLSDPDFDPLEVVARWNVRACVQVDAIGATMDPKERPSDRAWQDVYLYPSKERPDELNRLKKRIRLSCPPEEAPPGGLKVEGIDYPGTIWRFASTPQEGGSILITATARDPEAEVKEGEYDEQVLVRTNHPDKPSIQLHFLTLITKEAGSKAMDPDGAH